jgi:sugar/nucleoside kinase (ribokinase family)
VLAVVGDLLEDVVVRFATAPALGTDTPARIERRRGGSAANTAACAATAGAAVRFIGCIGTDEIGDRLVRCLAADGVDVRVQRRGHTGSVVVLVGPDGERTMLPDRGAATDLIDVDPEWFDGVTWLHVPSYSLLSEPIGAATRQSIVEVRRAGGGLSVDVSSVAIVECYGVGRFRKILDDLAPDVVFANHTESRLLPERGLPIVIVKDGPRPVRVRGADGEWEVEVPSLPDVADSTGAGDAFAAGYLAATIRGESSREAVAAGIDLAAQVLRR